MDNASNNDTMIQAIDVSTTLKALSLMLSKQGFVAHHTQFI
jgi:hypothetical protein